MIDIIIIFVSVAVIGLLLSKKGGAIDEHPVVWFHARGYEVTKWGYTHGLGDSEPSVLWVRANSYKKGKYIYMEFERNDDFEESYRHLQF